MANANFYMINRLMTFPWETMLQTA